jgi:hypothetical protein
MSKTVVIHQPDFSPYLGFFHRFLEADLYVVLDHVQFVYGSRAWTHRDKIKTPAGEKWLTLSVKKSPRGTAINEIEISQDKNWREDNIQLIYTNYKDAKFYSEILSEVEKLYSYTGNSLLEFNMNSIELLMDLLDVRIPLIYASSLEPEGHKNQLLIDLLRKVDATHYLSGVGAKDYFDANLFIESGIEIIWQNFTHPIYPQLHNDYIPYLSSFDVLFNCGITQSRKILRGI